MARDASFFNGLLKGANTSTKTHLETYKKRQEDEEEARLLESNASAIETTKVAEDQSKFNPGKAIGDAFNGIKEGVKNSYEKGTLVQDAGATLFGATSRLTNQGLGIVENTGAEIASAVTGNDQIKKDVKKRVDEEILADGKGLFRQGGIYKSTDELKNADALEVLRKAGGTGVESLTETIAPLKGAKSVGEATKVGGSVTKAVAAGAAENAALAAAGNAAGQVADDGSVDLTEVRDSALLGGALGGVLEGAGTAAGKAIRKVKGVDAPVETPTVNPDDALVAKTDADREAFLSNGLPNDPVAAKAALDDFESGNYGDAAKRPAQPVTELGELAAREDLPVEMKTAVDEVLQDRKVVEDQLYSLMSPERYDAEVKVLDAEYTAKQDALEGMNPVRAAREQARIDEEYSLALDELDAKSADDAEEVTRLQEINEVLDQRATQVTNDVNTLFEAAPDTFRDVDPVELQAQRELLTGNLDQAERFNSPTRIVDEVSQSTDPVATYDRNPDAQPAFQKEVSDQIDNISKSEVATKDIVDNFKNITGVKLSTLRVMSPSQVIESWGLRGEAVDLHSNILRAESALNTANKNDSEQLSALAKILPQNQEAQDQIIDYLERKRTTLSALGSDEAAQSIRQLLDTKRAELEELGFKTLDDYFPHVFDKKDPEVQRLFKGKETGTFSFGNLKQRKTDSQDYSKDILGVLSQYVGGVNRKIHLEPAIKPFADLQTQVDLTNAEAKWLDSYVTQLTGKDSGNPIVAKVLGSQRLLSSVATMGLNPGTAIRNLTQGVNTIAEIGPKYSTIGLADSIRALRAGKDSPEWAELQRAGIMEGGVSQNYFDAIEKPGVRGRVAKGRDAAVKGMMFMIRGTDIALRSQAYFGAKALAASKGLSGEAAENFAIRKTIDTQFITSRVDMPVAFNSQAVRSLTQLATFSGKQAGFLQRTLVGPDGLVKNKDGTFSLNPKKAGSILAAVATGAMATEVMKEYIGFKEEEWIPFYDQFRPFAGGIDPLNDALNGIGLEETNGDSLYRSPIVTILMGDGASKTGLIEALQGEGVDKFWEDNWASIVPGGTQLKKTSEGLDTTAAGVSRNGEGNVRYLQDMDIDSRIKASLFGQYSTDAGKAWISNGFPTLTPKQTEQVDIQNTREAKETYAKFYQAKKAIDFEVETADGSSKGRQAAYAQVKALVQSGNINAATRTAQEYNDAVNNSLGTFGVDPTKLPEELSDELTKQTYINIRKIKENAEG